MANMPLRAPTAKLPPRMIAPGRFGLTGKKSRGLGPSSPSGDRSDNNERKSVVGKVVVVVSDVGGALVPRQLRSPPNSALQLVQPVARSVQSATHSHTLPTMSCAPQ